MVDVYELDQRLGVKPLAQGTTEVIKDIKGWVAYEDHKKIVEEAYKRGVEAGIKQEKDAAEYWSRH